MPQYRGAITTVAFRPHTRKGSSYNHGIGAIYRRDAKWSIRRCLLVGGGANVVGWALIAALIAVLL